MNYNKNDYKTDENNVLLIYIHLFQLFDKNERFKTIKEIAENQRKQRQDELIERMRKAEERQKMK